MKRLTEAKYIDEGYTLNFLIPAFFILVGGAIAAYLDPLLSVPLFLAGIFLLLIKTGVEIDIQNKRVRYAYSFGKKRKGIWKNISKLNAVELKYTNQSNTFHSRSMVRTVRTKTYDIYFIMESGEKIHFHEFTNYDIAVRLMNILASHLKIIIKNEIGEKRNLSVKKRKLNPIKKKRK